MRGLDPRIHRLGKSLAKRRKALATAGWTAADFMNVAAGLLARGDTRPRSKQLPLRCWPISTWGSMAAIASAGTFASSLGSIL